MRVDVTRAEVYTPIFMKGSNLGMKFGTGHKFETEMVLKYDTELSCLFIIYKGDTVLVPSAGVASMNLKDINQLEKTGVVQLARETVEQVKEFVSEDRVIKLPRERKAS